MDLSNSEIRVLGCLLEKQRTTPDHYPLSLNSLRLACNQATNREPVVEYDDAIIRDALHRLERRGYTRLASGRRAPKYRHLLSEALPMSAPEEAVMCVLMLRGPQTPGELKQRGERMHAFDGLDEVHATLVGLIDRDLVARMERRPGQKEERYAQLLGQDTEPDAGVSMLTSAQPADHGEHSSVTSPGPGLAERIARLEQEVAELRAALAELRAGAEEDFDPTVVPESSASQESSAPGEPGASRALRESHHHASSHTSPGIEGGWSGEIAQAIP
jgi:uncharacterized protein